jgi:ketosteroid isomerase-like protein
MMSYNSIGVLKCWSVGGLPVLHHSTTPLLHPNREGLKQDIKGLLVAFSTPFTTDELIAEGDKVVIRGTFRSVHNGEFLGVPATGKEVTHTWTAILRIENGKVVERWANVDSMKFMTDLGVLPAPGQGGK